MEGRDGRAKCEGEGNGRSERLVRLGNRNRDRNIKK